MRLFEIERKMEKLPEKAQERLEAVIKKQIERKVRAHKENATNEDIEEEDLEDFNSIEEIV